MTQPKKKIVNGHSSDSPWDTSEEDSLGYETPQGNWQDWQDSVSDDDSQDSNGSGLALLAHAAALDVVDAVQLAKEVGWRACMGDITAWIRDKDQGSDAQHNMLHGADALSCNVQSSSQDGDGLSPLQRVVNEAKHRVMERRGEQPSSQGAPSKSTVEQPGQSAALAGRDRRVDAFYHFVESSSPGGVMHRSFASCLGNNTVA